MLCLPADLPHGYHELSIETAGRSARTRLIVAPRRAFLPEAMRGTGVWGLALQLYSLRGESDWGIGQFTDLRSVCDLIAKSGGDVAGVNPLHALFPGNPQSASPYSPSSRRFLNPIYIDVNKVPGHGRSGAARSLPEPGGQVDYAAVWPLKLKALRQAFAAFTECADRKQQEAFAEFTARGGQDLRDFARHQALEHHFGAASNQWPPAYQEPDSKEVADFAARHDDEVRFHLFLQWQAHEQLSAVRDNCAAQGMRIGLYGDLAVGADRTGADMWSNRDVYVPEASFGAPPDPLARQGQNWGLPPFHPVRLFDAGYQPFIDILRASMRYFGALRIDHVMWMQRMFFIPAGCETAEGAYMRFPLDDLLAIVALESQRQQCVVIGEDLGTVPAGFREKMEDHGLLCYRLMRFERYEDGLYKRPDRYPPLSLASFGSHDLPPIAGFWQGRDLDMLSRIGLIGDPEADAVMRRTDREQLLAALIDQDMLDAAAMQDGAPEIPALIDAVHGFLAKAPSALVMLNLEDVLHSETQINVPGTYLECPNWRLRHDLDTLEGGLAHAGRIMGPRSRTGAKPKRTAS